MNDRTLGWNQVGNVVVSTVNLDSMIQSMDSLISVASELVGGMEDRADLSTPGDYETMVFSCNTDGEITDRTELDFQRYNTKEEALLGHEEIVSKWEEKNDPR